MRPILITFVLLHGVGHGQTIFPRGVINAASFVPSGLPGGGIARGSLFSIFGKNLGPAASPALAFPLVTTLGGVSIKVSQGTASVDAIPVFVNPGQINAILPSNTPLGMVSVRVSYNGIAGNPSPVRVVDSSFGIFAVNSAGLGPGVMQNYVTAANQPVNSTQVTAKPGDIVTLYGTGLGAALGPDNAAPPAGDLPVTAQLTVGGQDAPVLYHGRSPCCSGLDQIVFKVPENAPLGCWVPVFVQTNNTTTSNAVTMAISNGPSCNDVLNPISQTLLKGGKVGAFLALRSTTREDIGTRTPLDVVTEYGAAIASQETGGAFSFNPFLSLPPAGSCTLYTASGDLFANQGAIAGSASTGKLLSTGPSLSVNGLSNIPSLFAAPLNVALLGVSLGGSVGTPLQLGPGSFTLTTDNADIPGSRASFTIPTALNWTNRDQISTINRAQPLTVTWTAASGQTVSIVGGGVDLPTNSSAIFQCIAPTGATSFTVPAAILSALPASRRLPSQTKAVLYVGTIPLGAGSVFGASGLDAAIAGPIFVNGRTVSFR